MSSYHTAGSEVGLTLPFFGRIVGDLAKDLRVPLEDLSTVTGVEPKTLQRLFKGESISADLVDQILRGVAKVAVPERHHLAFSEELVRLGCWWNQVATTVNVNTYPVTKVADLACAPLRLAALELAVRLGALEVAERLQGGSMKPLSTWLEPDLGAWLKAKMVERGLTVDGLAERLGVTRNTVDAWRQGNSLPTKHQVVAELAKALASDNEDEGDAVFALRLRAGATALRERIAGLVGKDRSDDLLAGLHLVARRTVERLLYLRNAFETVEPPVGMRALEDLLAWKRMNDQHKNELPSDARSVATGGLRSSLGRSLCEHLAALAEYRPQVRADFGALRGGDWASSIQNVYRQLGTVEHLANLSDDELTEFLPPIEEREEGELREMMKMVAPICTETQLELADFDRGIPEGMHVMRVELPPQIQAMQSSEYAAHLEASGDLMGAIAYELKAVALSPRAPVLRFRLGAYLGQLAAQMQLAKVQGVPMPGRLGRLLTTFPGNVEDVVAGSLKELREAVRLDVEFGNARNEIGIVLSNVGRHSEAELAFAEAEPFMAEHSHHWYCRGNNLLALSRFEEAAQAFERAKALNRGADHLDARMMLSATWMELGRGDKARAEGKPVESRRGFHPADHWQWLLALRHTGRHSPFPPPRIARDGD
jgi:transcriptional regulator with XRE-family HTH domain/tetratricopeptide (TPR) repeat protein